MTIHNIDDIRPIPTQGTMCRVEKFGAMLASGNKPILTLNEDALAIWNLCDGSKKVSEIKTLLFEEYEEKQLDQKLFEFINFCLSNNLLENKELIVTG
jgi:hypothetical protein